MSDGPARDPRNVVVRLSAFTAERFPPAPQLVLILVLWGAGMTMPIAFVGGVRPAPALDVLPALATLLGLLLMTFHLRVMDDVKDADHDRVHEQDRPIPRGLVTEREADVLTVLLIALEAPLFAFVGLVPLGAWAIATIYTVLMRLEFFVPDFLDRHVLTFATSHMLSMGLIFHLLLDAGKRSVDPQLTGLMSAGEIITAALASVFLGLGFEFGRKFERYQLGHGRVAWLLWWLVPTLGALGFACVACGTGVYPDWTKFALFVIAGVAGVAHLAVVVRTWRQHAKTTEVDAKARGMVELLPGVTGLLVYLVLAIGGAQLLAWQEL